MISRTKQLYTHSLNRYQKLGGFFQVVNKILVLETSRFFNRRKGLLFAKKHQKLFLWFSGTLYSVRYEILTVWLIVKEFFLRNENFSLSLVITYSKFRSTLKIVIACSAVFDGWQAEANIWIEFFFNQSVLESVKNSIYDNCKNTYPYSAPSPVSQRLNFP